MLSSVLKSQKAIEVNIQIIRTFTQLRELLSTHKDLREKIEKLEEKYDGKIKEIFDSIFIAPFEITNTIISPIGGFVI